MVIKQEQDCHNPRGAVAFVMCCYSIQEQRRHKMHAIVYIIKLDRKQQSKVEGVGRAVECIAKVSKQKKTRCDTVLATTAGRGASKGAPYMLELK